MEEAIREFPISMYPYHIGLGSWNVPDVLLQFWTKSIEDKTKLLNQLIALEGELFTDPDWDLAETFEEEIQDYRSKKSKESNRYRKLVARYNKISNYQYRPTNPGVLAFVYHAVAANPEIIVENSLMVTRACNFVHSTYQSDYEKVGGCEATVVRVATYLATGDRSHLELPEGNNQGFMKIFIKAERELLGIK
jgi:hypothetical protein